MPHRLERLVYESTATGSTGSLLNMATILAESQRNNADRGLTGALAAHGERFYQVIEGAPEALDGLLRRLENDPRHRDIRVLDRQSIDDRSFSQWTMANARMSPERGAELDRLMAEAEPSGTQVAAALHAMASA